MQAEVFIELFGRRLQHSAGIIYVLSLILSMQMQYMWRLTIFLSYSPYLCLFHISISPLFLSISPYLILTLSLFCYRSQCSGCDFCSRTKQLAASSWFKISTSAACANIAIDTKHDLTVQARQMLDAVSE